MEKPNNKKALYKSCALGWGIAVLGLLTLPFPPLGLFLLYKGLKIAIEGFNADIEDKVVYEIYEQDRLDKLTKYADAVEAQEEDEKFVEAWQNAGYNADEDYLI